MELVTCRLKCLAGTLVLSKSALVLVAILRQALLWCAKLYMHLEEYTRGKIFKQRSLEFFSLVLALWSEKIPIPRAQ